MTFSKYNHFIVPVIYLFVTLFNLGCAPAENQSSTVDIDQKIGQMLMVGFAGFEAADRSHIVRDIQSYHIGGVILFDYDVPRGTPDRNIDSPEQVTTLNTDLQNLSEIPLFIAIDQEGGRVARLKPDRGFPETVSARYLGDLNNADSTSYHASRQADLLQKIGFNVNFAPVVDLNTNPQNPVIGRLDRSYGAEPDLVTKHAEIVIKEHLSENVLPVIKHFPGHGSARNDSHVGMADVTDTWEDIELKPYQNLLEGEHPFGVMTAHVLNKNLDPEFPATLSEKVQTDILRNSLNFQGVLFSDDMQMEAIRSFYGLEYAIEKAILAGVDVLVFANNSVYEPDIVPEIVEIIKQMVENGTISEERIEESYRRIMDAKVNLGLME